jgi:hypothetical protein
MGTIKLTPEATRDLIAEGPVERAAYFDSWVQGLGGKLLGYYFAENSEIDIVTLMELPDEMRASAARSMATWASNWSTGMSRHLEVTWLATPEELSAGLGATGEIATPGHE